jgi:predicted Zn finger-like uncharacterized protein
VLRCQKIWGFPLRVTCPTCRAAYAIDERRVPPSGLNVRCPKCQQAFPVRPPEVSEAAVALPDRVSAVRPSAQAEQSAAPVATTLVGSPPLATFPPSTSMAPPPPAWPAEEAEPDRGAQAPAAAPARFPEEPDAGVPAEPAAPTPATPGMGFSLGGDPFSEPPPEEDDPFRSPFPAEPAEEAAAPPAASPPGFGELDLGEPPPVPPLEDPFSFDQPSPSGAGPEPGDEPPPSTDPFLATVPSPSTDPFLATAPSPPTDPFLAASPPPGEAPEPQARPVGLGALGPREAEELEALFDEVKPRPGPAESPPPALRVGPSGPFMVRRRSGKVFGPFTESEIAEMLGRGELLGNEDVSADGGESYKAIGTVPAFAAALRHLTDVPVSADAPHAPPGPLETTGARGVPGLRARAGRLADSLRERLAGTASRRPRLLLAGAALLLVGIGASVAVSQYGTSFRGLLHGRLGANRAGAKLLAEAHQGLAQDGYSGVRSALDLADRALRLDGSDDEAKAVYAHAASLLKQRHGGAGGAWPRAQAFLSELSGKEAGDPEVAEALLEGALASGERPSDAAVTVLQTHLTKQPRDDDALAVLGDVALSRAELAGAASRYQAIAQHRPGDARAAHGLGMVALARGDLAAARKAFESALGHDARHLASAVELARLDLATGDLAQAQARARSVLAPEARGDAGPAERARARAILGQVLAHQLGGGRDPQPALAAAEAELARAIQEDPDDVEPRVALARFELARGAPQKATEALEPVAGRAASDPRVADARARALAAQGRVLDALTLLDGAIDKQPGEPRLLSAKAFVLDQSGKREEAARLWADAAARDPAAWEPHLMLGRALLRRGDLDAAEKELEAAVTRAPREARARTGIGELKLARKDLGGAEAAYRSALEADPASAEPYLGLARVALAQGDRGAARKMLERALLLNPGLGPAQALYGDVLLRARDLAGAKKAFRAAVSIDPADGFSRARLGEVELESQEVDAAVADLLAASNLEMGSAEIRDLYGRALLAKGEVTQALEQLRKAVDLDPKSSLYQLHLGRAHERASNISEAIDAYRAAIGLAPTELEPYRALAALYASRDRCADALPLLDRAMAIAHDEPELRVDAADCKMKLGHPGEAIATYKSALGAAPRIPGLSYKIARAVHESAGAKEAFPWYERAARENPGDAMPHYYLGFAFKDRGQRARAIAEFRAYLRAKPDAYDRKDIEREIEYLGGAQ